MDRIRPLIAALLVSVLAVSLLPAIAGGRDVAAASPYIHRTWTKADSPHIFEHGAFVDSRTSVTIEAGAEVRLGPGAWLTVEGVLNASGTEEEPILFTSTSPGEGWGGIGFQASGFPNYRSTLSRTVIQGATGGVVVHAADADIVENTFRDNDVAFRARNPQYDLTLKRNVFEGNRVAVTGYTRGTITVRENDFWNNEVNLLPRPEPMYDCGSDSGVWEIHKNDILRGPVNAEFFSNDVRTPPGSAVSSYAIDATDNWWGTIEEERIRGRMTVQMDCCPPPAEKEVVWRPVALVAQTPYEPSGEIPDPDPEPSGHGDPGVVTEFDEPVHGSCIAADSFDRLRGGFGGGLGGPREVTLAVRRKTASGCRWWSPERRRLVPGGCAKKRWFPAVVRDRDAGPQWRYVFPKELPRGRYMAWSYGLAEPTHLGRNQVAFRLQ